MAKVDLKKELDSYRARQGEFRVVDVPLVRYLMVDGHGDPNTGQDYADALAAIFPVAYKLKFASKSELDRDYVVMPLEAWWASDMDAFTTARNKSTWDWTAMILVPDWITPEIYDASVAAVARKDPPTSLEKVRLEPLREGRCVQTLHVGSYDDETLVLAEMHHEFIPHARLKMIGRHHEIYLSDPRRVPPSKLRTILRQPVVPVEGDPSNPAGSAASQEERVSHKPTRLRTGSARARKSRACAERLFRKRIVMRERSM